MKFLFPILFLIVVSCKSKKPETENFESRFELGKEVVAKVSKIDSISNYYLVFIANDKDSFKIISDKNQAKYYNGTKLDIGENYKFVIQQITNRRPTGPNNQLTPMNYLDLTQCRTFDKTEICTESSFELALASNLKGLYLRKD